MLFPFLSRTALAVLALAAGLHTQSSAAPLSLAQAFERAWARQPETAALAQREAAAAAQQRAASSWTPEPPALEAAVRSDRFHARDGAREVEIGIAVPIWLPGERARAQALADAQAGTVNTQALLAQWHLAEALREAWWAQRRDAEERVAAQIRAQTAALLADDVARRVRAGDLARADQHQAQAALAAAQAELALAEARAEASSMTLRQLIGLPADQALQLADEAEALPGETSTDQHPLLQALRGKAASARSAAALAQVQARGQPELTLLQTRDRAARSEATVSTLTLGLRFPLGRSSQHQARVASAGADQTEAEIQLQREQEHLAAQQQSARVALAAAERVLSAATERARLAAETQAFFDKAFRLGEADLPTRLRVDSEAGIAQRELARARIARHQAVAQLRQALGLLPSQP